MDKKLPLKIIFLNVGHGDGIIILLPDEDKYKSAIIVDCYDGRKAYKILENYNIKNIEAMIITHFHLDHYRGFDILFEKIKKNRIKMKNIYYMPDKTFRENDEKKKYKMFLNKLYILGINNDFVINSSCIDGKNESKSIIKNEEIEIKIIYPRLIDITSECNVNNYSAVLQLIYKNNKILLPGDLEAKGWFKLYEFTKENKLTLTVDILKMPHHGAFYEENEEKTLGTNEILQFIKPNYAIISSAQNKKYNHPDIKTIKKLLDKKIKILCTNSTDICGKEGPCFDDIVIDIENSINIEKYDKKIKTLRCLQKDFK